MVRHVRTEAGSKKYGLPIGAPITARAIQQAAEKAGKAATPGKATKASAVRRLTVAEERRIGNGEAGLNPHRFGNRGEAEAFGKAQPKRIHPDAVAEFGEIANALRAGHGHERAEKIDAAMQPLDRDLVVTRHLPSSAFGPRRKAESLVGKKITDKAYQPAALHQEPQQGGITMHITAPAGTRAMMAGDNEIWLDRDTQLAVQSVEPNDHGGYDVHAVVLTKPTRKNAKKPPEAGAATAPEAKPETSPPGAKPQGGAAQFHRDLAGIEDLANTVEHSKVRDEKKLGAGSIADTRLRTYANGKQVVWKRSDDPNDSDAEQLAAQVARALGLPAPRVYRDEKLAVSMDYVPDAKIAAEHLNPGKPMAHLATDTKPGPEWLDSNEGRMMGLLDQLINNQDRHAGNWMISDDGHIVPIDHGFSFPVNVETPNRENVGIDKPGIGARDTWVSSPFAAHFSKLNEKGGGWKDNDLTAGDVKEIRSRLEKLRSNFEHVGVPWLMDFMMDRLGAIGEHAKGTESRLLPSLLG